MKEKIIKIHRLIKEWLTQVLFKKYLTPLMLVIIYFMVVGPTSVIAKIFFRKALMKSSNSQETNWISVSNYEGTIEDGLKQS